MSQRSTSVKNVTVTLWGIIDEIDDDDEDILEISIDVSNDSNQDMWDLHGDVRAMDGTHGIGRELPSRIESNAEGNLMFWIPSKTGAWLFKLDYNTDSGHQTIELGPFADDLRIAPAERPIRVNESVEESNIAEMIDVASNDDPLAMAFVTALDGFGDDSESELIEDAVSADPMQAAFASSILESKQAPADSGPTSAPSSPPNAPTGPPSAPPSAPTGPPSAPPSAPTGPPTGPPSAPPSAPTGPPSAPPSAPTGPPSAPPSAPAGPPTGPPSAPPSAPAGPPTGPSSGPPGPPPK